MMRNLTVSKHQAMGDSAGVNMGVSVLIKLNNEETVCGDNLLSLSILKIPFYMQSGNINCVNRTFH